MQVVVEKGKNKITEKEELVGLDINNCMKKKGDRMV